MARLPVELFESIIAESWYLPLDNQDRLHLMKTFPLICRFWLRAYHRISFIDMFVPSRAYVDYYLHFIFLEKGKHSLFRMDDSEEIVPIAEYISSHCRSITVIMSHKNHPNLSWPFLFPHLHLRRVSFIIDDLREQPIIIRAPSRLPPSVDEIEIIFPHNDYWMHQIRRLFLYLSTERYLRYEGLVNFILPIVRKVTFKGANFALLFIDELRCPILETLITDAVVDIGEVGFDIVYVQPPPSNADFLKSISRLEPRPVPEVKQEGRLEELNWCWSILDSWITSWISWVIG
ncbi:uncharacterized protein EV420DRAFT_490303 [Desarmillaria tabescens]|uniref:Uncharacterized protein n=1 Tax=Armillaria tabescens TaxID=1929756 RepID=A0AA39MGY7_ARMTA|nr:uncharacterized protein EV420DRAFT_490303 [Desarmillaria tabescens]KAK0433907.1 hypothetical protein EV420DRAFT_490303 [Desarmillaria tabescens]